MMEYPFHTQLNNVFLNVLQVLFQLKNARPTLAMDTIQAEETFETKIVPMEMYERDYKRHVNMECFNYGKVTLTHFPG